MKQSDMANYLAVWNLFVVEDPASPPGRFLTDGSGTVPFPSQVPHFACCVPLPLQRWHDGEFLAPMWPVPLQLGQVVRVDPVPLQVPHVGILAVFANQAGLMCMLEGTSRGNRGQDGKYLDGISNVRGQERQ